MAKEEELYEDEFRDSISTVDETGKRIWVYPKKPKGFFHKWRLILSVFLIALLFAAPHIRIGGQPLVLIGILERKFVLFGKVFWPQDLYIFAFTMILLFVFIILFTVVFGRIFCGWICPQTIFMEFVFRKIEYWIEGDWTHQKKLNKQRWNREKIFKKTAKHSLFLLISFLIGNTFLAYIIGSDALWEIQTAPLSTHLGGFMAMIIFSLVFYGVFAFLREQVCTTICPYGRLQGVLLDEDSVIVAYDHVRGESRGRYKKTEDRDEVGKGDCIDCKQCVHVCPTGIDIRNGTQLECVNCTACIDACDDIMEAVNLPKGLIRYASESNIEGGKKFVYTKRMKSYTVLLGLLLIIWGTLIGTRTDFQAVVLKKRGSSYQQLDGGIISNIYEIELINKSKNSFDIDLKLEDGIDGEVNVTKAPYHLGPEEHTKNNFIIKLNNDELERGQKKLKIIVLGNGEELLKVKTRFIGPLL
jgi:cytochrome c oxidase accessory protein FixG